MAMTTYANFETALKNSNSAFIAKGILVYLTKQCRLNY